MSTEGSSFRLTVPATLEALREISQAIEEFLGRVEAMEEREVVTYNVVLAVQELCANIVQHGYAGQAGTIAVHLQTGGRPLGLTVTVEDKAPRIFDEAGWLAPNLNEPKEHGLGIWLIKQLMDEVIYQPAAGNNRWQLKVALPIQPGK